MESPRTPRPANDSTLRTTDSIALAGLRREPPVLHKNPAAFYQFARTPIVTTLHFHAGPMVTISHLVRDSFRDFRRYPIRTLFLLGVVPNSVVAFWSRLVEPLHTPTHSAAFHEMVRLGRHCRLFFDPWGRDTIRSGPDSRGSRASHRIRSRGSVCSSSFLSRPLAVSTLWHGIRTATQSLRTPTAVGALVSLIGTALGLPSWPAR